MLSTSVALAIGGTIITAVVVGFTAAWLLDLSTLEGLLLGSIVAATDGAAIFSVLRGSSIERRLARILEAESALNDPVAIVLVLGFIEWIQQPDYGLLHDDRALRQPARDRGCSRVRDGTGRRERASRRCDSTPRGCIQWCRWRSRRCRSGQPTCSGGSGFLAVYLTGLALGSATIPARRTVEEFHDGLAWVSQIAVFFTLGLLVFPSEFDDIFGEAVLIVVVLMFVARPLATFVATRVGAVPLRQSVLLGWAGLRGAVPIVLATFPVTEDVPGAEAFFSIVFFVVLTSALVQGVTFESLAEALGLTKDEPALTRPLHEVGTIRHLGAEVYEYPVREKDAIVGKLVNELGLPRQALISVIVREGQALLPRGSTEIEAGDRLHILVRQPERERVEGLFDRWREGPIGEIEEPIPTIQGRTPIFSVRPWRDDYGDPGDPEAVEGVKVVRAVRVRRGEPGALVQLEDGRFAVTGPDAVATGGARQLFRYCRDRIRRADRSRVALVVAGGRGRSLAAGVPLSRDCPARNPRRAGVVRHRGPGRRHAAIRAGDHRAGRGRPGAEPRRRAHGGDRVRRHRRSTPTPVRTGRSGPNPRSRSYGRRRVPAGSRRSTSTSGTAPS